MKAKLVAVLLLMSTMFGVGTLSAHALTSQEAETIINALNLEGSEAAAIRSLVANGEQPPQSELVNSVASRIWMFQSKPLFMSWALRQVKIVSLDMVPDGASSSGGYLWYADYTSPFPKIKEMGNLVESFDIKFELVRRVRVDVNVHYRGTNYSDVLFEGKESFWPLEKSGGWEIPEWVRPEMRIAQNIRIKIPDVQAIQLFLRDEHGDLKSEKWLSPSDGYFSFPRQMIDNSGELAAYFQDGSGTLKHVFISIRNGQELKKKSIAGEVEVELSGAQVLKDPAEINIRPNSRNNMGEDILTEVTFTEKSLVPVSAKTSEGELAPLILVINLSDMSERVYHQNAGFIINVPFTKGTYHVVPVWETFQDNTLEYNYTGGGKGGGTAGGDGGW